MNGWSMSASKSELGRRRVARQGLLIPEVVEFDHGGG